MIDSADIKEAITIELLKAFGSVAIYSEGDSKVLYPHFFIYEIGASSYEGRKNYHHLDFSMDVRYRVASDPSTVKDLQGILNDVGFRLLENFNIIKYNDSSIRCEDKSIEKVDNVLHFFFHCKILAKYVPDKEETKIKFDKMKLNLEVRK